MSYPEKRGEQLTGRWYGVVQLRKLFEDKASADYYESHLRAFGEEPDRARTVKSEAEKCVSKLEEELYLARCDIVELMPHEIAKLLTSYHSCISPLEFTQWKGDVIDRIVSMLEIDPEEFYLERRGCCPLCKGEGRGPLRGFKLPGGLTLHLWGGNNAHQCPVTHAAFRNGHFRLRDTFKASDEGVQRKMDERRRTERVFVTDPSLPPQLFDEHLYPFSSDKPRSADELAEAEERLRGLNFQIEVND